MGCVGFPGAAAILLDSGGKPAARRPAGDTSPVPDLRIPPESVAYVTQPTGTEIPLVPLPLPPGERPAPAVLPAATPAARTTAPASPAPAPVQPVAAQGSAAAPTLTSGPAPASSQTIQAPPPPLPQPSKAALSPDPLRFLYQQAQEKYAGIDSYIVRMTRREQVNGKNQPEEVMMFKFRKEPFSIYFKWLGNVSRGREATFVKGQYENKIHTLLAAGDMPLMPAGRRISLPFDSMLVRSNSRHSITEAGIGVIIEKGRVGLEAAARGDTRRGRIAYLGQHKRPDYDGSLELVEQTILPGAESELPHGGRRLIGFDPELRLPMLVQAFNERGQEVEYYRYDRFQAPVKLDDADFDPDQLWPTKAGARLLRGS